MGLIASYTIDLFTINHVLLWALFGALFARSRMGIWGALALGLFVGLSWELAEVWIEQLLGFREPWANRWLADPLADIFGTFCGWAMANWYRLRSQKSATGRMNPVMEQAPVATGQKTGSQR